MWTVSSWIRTLADAPISSSDKNYIMGASKLIYISVIDFE